MEMNILILDKDKDYASFLKGLAIEWKHRAKTVYSGDDAISALLEEKYDLLLLDVNLPDGGGGDIISKIKTLSPNTGIITMTNANSRNLEYKIRQLGIIYYMIKPFDPTALKTIIDHMALRKRNQASE